MRGTTRRPSAIVNSAVVRKLTFSIRFHQSTIHTEIFSIMTSPPACGYGLKRPRDVHDYDESDSSACLPEHQRQQSSPHMRSRGQCTYFRITIISTYSKDRRYKSRGADIVVCSVLPTASSKACISDRESVPTKAHTTLERHSYRCSTTCQRPAFS